MQRLSAIDAVSPAWKHTSQFLVEPRDWKLLLKVGLVAAFAGAGGGSANLNVPGGGVNNAGNLGHLPHFNMAQVLPFLIVGGVVILMLVLVLFYVSARMQLVFFEMVLRKDTQVGPIWKRYEQLTWRWIGLRLLFTLAALVCMLPFALPMIFAFKRMSQDGSNSLGVSIVLILASFSLLFLIVLVFSVAFRFVADFGLPMMALEDATISGTLDAVRRMVFAEPGQFAIYFLARIVLAVCVGLASALASVIIVLILAIPLGGAAGILYLLLGHNPGAHVLLIVAWVLLGLIAFVLLMMFGFMVAGLAGTFNEAYALYFLGGRYAPAGAYLEGYLPPPPPVWQPYATPPPPFAPPAY